MKKVLFATILALCCFAASAQQNTIMIFCQINQRGMVDYGSLPVMLSDSAKAAYLVDPKKEYNIKGQEDVLLFMSLQGWKLITAVPTNEVGSFIRASYMLGKEIQVSPARRQVMIEMLKKNH